MFKKMVVLSVLSISGTVLIASAETLDGSDPYYSPKLAAASINSTLIIDSIKLKTDPIGNYQYLAISGKKLKEAGQTVVFLGAKQLSSRSQSATLLNFYCPTRVCEVGDWNLKIITNTNDEPPLAINSATWDLTVGASKGEGRYGGEIGPQGPQGEIGPKGAIARYQ